MKITKDYLKQVIKEELNNLEEAAPSLVNQMNYLTKMRESKEKFKEIYKKLDTLKDPKQVGDLRTNAEQIQYDLVQAVSDANLAIEILLRKYVFSKADQPPSTVDLARKDLESYSLLPITR